jgi:hypothetical protein
MRTLLLLLALIPIGICQAENYEAINEQKTLKTEYRDGRQVSILTKDSITVAVTLMKEQNSYGRFYQAGVMVMNGKGDTFTFAPEDIIVNLTDNRNASRKLGVYTSDDYTKSIRRSQDWARFFNSVFDSMVADNAYAAASANEMTRIMHDKERNSMTSGYLKKNTMRQGDVVEGFLNIHYSKGRVLMMRIPVNGQNFDFMWDVK